MVDVDARIKKIIDDFYDNPNMPATDMIERLKSIRQAISDDVKAAQKPAGEAPKPAV